VFELTRLVRDPDADVPLSALVALTVKWLRRKQLTDLVVSYADAGHGHHGGIYQACSWQYHGQRRQAQDGLVIDSMFVPNRAVSATFGTKSVDLLRGRGVNVDGRHVDAGKHLYWRALCRDGAKKASRLGLTSRPYVKPDISTEDAA
jgi:hypothetical protein